MFWSNIASSTSHNFRVVLKKNEERTYRVFVKPVEKGTLDWRFMYSNTVDSTFDNGSVSRANLSGGNFRILWAKAGTADTDRNLLCEKPVTWNGEAPYDVKPNEVFTSDPVKLTVSEGEYLAFTWRLMGLDDETVIPSTPDSRLITFEGDKELVQSCGYDTPMPDMFAADRSCEKKMVFIGDSITQGCGTPVDTLEQWAARIGMGIDRRIGVWNIGLGFGRASDAASDGAWLKKAAQADIVNVCFGVNDILQSYMNGDAVVYHLRRIVRCLKKRNPEVRVILFTVPPFDMQGVNETTWRYVQRAIREDGLGSDKVFDIAKIIGQPEPMDNMAFFGSHPDGRGGAAVCGEYLSRIYEML